MKNVGFLSVVSALNSDSGNRAQQAEMLFRHALALKPRNPLNYRRGLGYSLALQRQENEAIVAWQGTSVQPLDIFVAWGDKARLERKYNKAFYWYQKALDVDMTYAKGWHHVGLCHQEVGEKELAIEAYRHAFSLGYAECVTDLAKLFWKNNSDLAIPVLKEALEKFPTHDDRLQWWQILTNSLRANSRWEEGLKTVNQALQEYPDDARLYVEKGAMIYDRSANSDAAINILKKAIDLNNTIKGANSTIARIYAAEEEYDLAYEWYSREIYLAPENPSPYVARGHMARAVGNLPLAVDLFRETMKKFPDFSPAYFGLARAYQDIGNKEDAVVAVNQALQVAETKDVQDYLIAAEIYEWSGNYDKAISAYQHVLAIDSSNTAAVKGIRRLKNK